MGAIPVRRTLTRVFDVAVVGGGIMGAAAARRLSRHDLSIAVVAPPEPPSGGEGPYGAHHDVSRLTWLHHLDDVETELARRSLAAIDEVEALADHTVFSRSGQLFIAEDGLEPERVAMAEAAAAAGAMELLDEDAAAERYPGLAIPHGARVMLEPPPSGYFDPRELVASHLRAAVRAGAEHFRSPAVQIDDGLVTFRDGRTISARKVLVANGAYVNTPGLLPRPVALRLKTETVLLAEIPPSEAARLAQVPPIIYALHDPAVADVYTAPPLVYPDGRVLMKWGANTIMDHWVSTPDEIDGWYRIRRDLQAIELMSPSMLRTYPGLDVSEFHTMHCVVAYTGHGMPYIDVIQPGKLYLAAGGNGHSAKWSSALGELAASLVLHDGWVDPLPADLFRVQWEGEVRTWAGEELLSLRRR